MGKREFFRSCEYVLFLIFFCIILLPFFSAVVTELDVPTTAPYLVEPIPNQTWLSDNVLSEAFDLDDYFFDNQGFSLSYWADSVENISITIDTENKVSFFPDIGFMGTRTVVFYATNGYYNSSSNVVYLNVGIDEEPPQWSQPQTNRPTIYQNSVINFTTLWTDNFQLNRYVFSINQGTGWTNYSIMNFSGTTNVSIYGIQISAAAGTMVYWRFYAWDSSLNMNVTGNQSFNVSSRVVPDTEINRTVVDRIISDLFPTRNISNFSISPDFFTVTLRRNRPITNILRVMNIGTQTLIINISEQNLRNFVIFSVESFSIEPGERREVTIDFNAPLDIEIGEYFGYIVVESSSEKKRIPVVIDVKDELLRFDLNVTVHKKNFIPGEEVRADIVILNSENLNEKKGVLSYSIKDLNGNVYDVFEEDIDFSENLVFERYLSTPGNSPDGFYIFYARIETAEAIAIDSDLFELGIKSFYLAFLRPFLLFLLILLLAFLFSILMIKYKKYRARERTLTLYLMLMNLKRLIEKDKLDEALDLYILIKSRYSEKVPKSTIENKEQLKQEIKSILLKLKKELPKKSQEEINAENPEENKETGSKAEKSGKKEGEEKKDNKEEIKEDKKEISKEIDKEEKSEESKAVKEENKEKKIEEKEISKSTKKSKEKEIKKEIKSEKKEITKKFNKEDFNKSKKLEKKKEVKKEESEASKEKTESANKDSNKQESTENPGKKENEAKK